MHTKPNQILDNQLYRINLDYSYIVDSINNASDIVAPAWTLKSFVASNPLQGLEKYKFADALQNVKEFFKTDIFSDSLDLREVLRSNNINEDLAVKQIKKQLNWSQEYFKFSGKELSINSFISSSLIRGKQNLKQLKRFGASKSVEIF